ncbi:MAG: methionine adenosyltransferase [Bacteroidetes bacterium]|nr:methionine adenosyltransferase [Bacteroidota bacterium]
MMKKKFLFTSESVSEGHPDKVADQISDAVLDAFLAKDPESKVACETFVTHKGVIVGGEVFSKARIKKKIPDIIRSVIRDIGYDHHSDYDPDEISIQHDLNVQSPEIRSGVDAGGAGDQGLMFGYACNETPNLMPLAIHLSHRILEKLAELRKSRSVPWLLPDAKSQVTVKYEGNEVVGIDTIVLSTQHMLLVLGASSPMQGSGYAPHGHYGGSGYYVTPELIRKTMMEQVIKDVIPEQFEKDPIHFIINRSGSFTKGGPAADTGLTGRKIIVDTYGGSCPHGGGAFSGKDASKMDRSAAYMGRYIAKNIVAARIAEKCLVQIAYVISQAEPISFMLDFSGTGKVNEDDVSKLVLENMDLRPAAIIERLDLKRPIFRKTAAYGHFGRELPEFTWEKTDLIDTFR